MYENGYKIDKKSVSRYGDCLFYGLFLGVRTLCLQKAYTIVILQASKEQTGRFHWWPTL